MVNYHKLSKELDAKIVKEYLSENITQLDLGKRYGVSSVQIANVLKKYKVTPIKRRGFYNVDLEYFKQIDTPNKAYFLGLFHSDGCNSNNPYYIRINLQEEDKQILEKLRLDIKYEGPLKYIKKQGNRKNQWSLYIVSKNLSEDLTNLGYPKNKTHKVLFPKYIDKPLIRHFIRGVFDGDGCIHVKKHHTFSIVGTYDTLLGIQEYFNNYLEVKSIIVESQSKGIFRLIVSKMMDIFNILTHLYKDSELYLDRKYNIYEKKYIIEKCHLYWKIYFKNIKTEEVSIFNNMQELKKFLGLKSYGSIDYCIRKSKNKIYKNLYYLNLLRNEQIELGKI